MLPFPLLKTRITRSLVSPLRFPGNSKESCKHKLVCYQLTEDLVRQFGNMTMQLSVSSILTPRFLFRWYVTLIVVYIVLNDR
jgi:hypothetical protein